MTGASAALAQCISIERNKSIQHSRNDANARHARNSPNKTSFRKESRQQDHCIRPHSDFAAGRHDVQFAQALRSEEHTSELQSQSNLVCRLLLEKKKQ